MLEILSSNLVVLENKLELRYTVMGICDSDCNKRLEWIRKER